MPYLFKNQKREEVRKYNLTKMSDVVGIDAQTLYRIVNGHSTTTKVTAFSITKAFDKDAEIDYYFDSVNYE